jgi:hypothetical protein
MALHGCHLAFEPGSFNDALPPSISLKLCHKGALSAIVIASACRRGIPEGGWLLLDRIELGFLAFGIPVKQ